MLVLYFTGCLRRADGDSEQWTRWAVTYLAGYMSCFPGQDLISYPYRYIWDTVFCLSSSSLWLAKFDKKAFFFFFFLLCAQLRISQSCASFSILWRAPLLQVVLCCISRNGGIWNLEVNPQSLCWYISLIDLLSVRSWMFWTIKVKQKKIN